jgi:hypothetical protein
LDPPPSAKEVEGWLRELNERPVPVTREA